MPRFSTLVLEEEHLEFRRLYLPSRTHAAMKLKDACSLGKKSYDQPRLHIKKQRHYFANKGPSNQSYAFSSSRVWM